MDAERRELPVTSGVQETTKTIMGLLAWRKKMKYPDIRVNGYPVVMSLSIVTEPGEGWKGSTFIGEYRCTKDLNAAIAEHKDRVPVGWMLEVDFQDDIEDPLS